MISVFFFTFHFADNIDFHLFLVKQNTLNVFVKKMVSDIFFRDSLQKPIPVLYFPAKKEVE